MTRVVKSATGRDRPNSESLRLITKCLKKVGVEVNLLFILQLHGLISPMHRDRTDESCVEGG